LEKTPAGLAKLLSAYELNGVDLIPSGDDVGGRFNSEKRATETISKSVP
jgi:hypothetical protein